MKRPSVRTVNRRITGNTKGIRLQATPKEKAVKRRPTTLAKFAYIDCKGFWRRKDLSIGPEAVKVKRLARSFLRFRRRAGRWPPAGGGRTRIEKRAWRLAHRMFAADPWEVRAT